jgi:CBS domain-containing protein/anti-sigma regulatory factor (Ser/Thr protein kinase)
MKDEKRFTKIQELTYELKIGDAMVKDVHTISPESTINDLRIMLKNQKISGVPVVKDKKLEGIISIEDLIRCLIAGRLDCRVSDEMTRNVETVYSDEPLIHAVNKFDRYGYGRFPVIERGTGELAGIITKGDIVKCLLKKLEVDYHEEEIKKYRASHIFEDINSDGSSLILRFSVVGGDFKKAGEQSSKLKKNLLYLNIHPDKVRRITIASYEAEMNIVIFTPGGELIAEIDDEKVKVTALDRGPGIPDIALAMQPGYSTAPAWVKELGFGAGMGLPNIKKCSDEMNIVSEVGKGTKLDFVVYTKNEVAGNC